MSRFLLATADNGFEERVRAALGPGLNGDLRRVSEELVGLTPTQAVDSVTSVPGGMPDVVVLGPGLAMEAALSLARRFDQDRPEINVVLVSKASPTLMRNALRAGVRDVLEPDADTEELRTILEGAAHSAARRRSNLAADPQVRSGGQVISVLSPKGGSGKTTVATNLAVGLAAIAPDDVVLVDLDVQFGDVASALRLIPDHTLAEAAEASDLHDSLALKVFLAPHASRLLALCAPESPAEGEQISPERAAQVIRLLASEFRYVVVDTSAGLSEHTLAALEVSTDAVLVCTMDVASVRSLRKEMDALTAIGMTDVTQHVVLNRAHSRVGLEVDDIERTLGRPVDVSLPSTRAVPLSMNQGRAVLELEPRSPVSRQLETLIGRFRPQEERAVATSRFGRKRT